MKVTLLIAILFRHFSQNNFWVFWVQSSHMSHLFVFVSIQLVVQGMANEMNDSTADAFCKTSAERKVFQTN